MINITLFEGNFLDNQKRYNRVRTAIKEKDNIIKNNNIKLE
ncbi:hypothetical protein [Brachyspira sp.]|nr:hypothetical protein [Brachyspira sp.]